MEDIGSDSASDHGSYSQARFINQLRHSVSRWNRKEIGFVRRAVQTCRTPAVRQFFIVVNHLGNGWIYVISALLLIAFLGSASVLLLVTAGLAAALAHGVYPVIKKRIARIRPCDYDRSLNLSVKVLDEYSCPSGHVMTSTAVSIPIAIAHPALSPLLVACCLLIGWARISLGHHYPSDLLIGVLLGSAISLPVSVALL